jgi:hypothetical protein
MHINSTNENKEVFLFNTDHQQVFEIEDRYYMRAQLCLALKEKLNKDQEENLIPIVNLQSGLVTLQEKLTYARIVDYQFTVKDL